VGGAEALLRPVLLVSGGFQFPFGSLEVSAPIGWGRGEDGLMFVPFGEEAADVVGVVVGSEAGLGYPQEGVEDFPWGAAVLGEDAAVVDLGEASDVPGVGGVPGAALAGVAGEAFQGGGAQQVYLGPGPTLDAVDDQRNAKLVLNVVLGGDALGYDLYRRRAAGGGSADVTPDG
jgi:hypothetical protein